jgi:hypothetical protein
VQILCTTLPDSHLLLPSRQLKQDARPNVKSQAGLPKGVYTGRGSLWGCFWNLTIQVQVSLLRSAPERSIRLIFITHNCSFISLFLELSFYQSLNRAPVYFEKLDILSWMWALVTKHISFRLWQLLMYNLWTPLWCWLFLRGVARFCIPVTLSRNQ